MRLRKLHGLGNDFLIALEGDQSGAVDLRGRDLAGLARQLCDRHTGVGADGLVAGLDPDAPGADVTMVLHNSDGSRAEMSGNGIRCLAHAVADARGALGALVIDTDGGRRHLEVAAGASPSEVLVRVEMGPVGEGPPVPTAVADLLGAARHLTLDMGNPHLVVEVPDPGAVDLAAEGPLLEAAFAGGINVEFAAAAGPDVIDMAVWERGAGITEACGTGACATAAAMRAWGAVGPASTVRMPGGAVRVELGEGGVELRGPSVCIAVVHVDDRSLP